MKKILYILIGALALTSCEKWLDVAPNTDVPAKELFTTENGFMSSLAGLYISWPVSWVVVITGMTILYVISLRKMKREGVVEEE